jgi:hypothetical protein
VDLLTIYTDPLYRKGPRSGLKAQRKSSWFLNVCLLNYVNPDEEAEKWSGAKKKKKKKKKMRMRMRRRRKWKREESFLFQMKLTIETYDRTAARGSFSKCILECFH